MKISKNQRNSNLELLRIIAMVFIVSHHFAVHGFGDCNFVISNPNNYLIYFLGIFGKIGVDIFVLISAYFMVNSRFTLRKLLVLGGGVYFYSLAALLIVLLFVPAIPITPGLLLSAILPISHDAYWFITCYVVLMLISPFLNKLVERLSKKDFLRLLALLIIMWSIYPTFTGNSFGYSELAWFVVLYFIGAFIRLHLDINKFSSKKLFVILIVSFILLYLASSIMGQLAIIFNVKNLANGSLGVINVVMFLAGDNKLFVLIISIMFFLIFLKRKEFSNKYINYVAGSTLGVYLIHDNDFIRQYLWDHLINVSSYYYSPNLWIVAIISIVSIYLVCTGIDIIRRETVEKLWICFVDNKLIDFLNRIYIKALNLCTNVLPHLLR